jgi:hypothetical protein
MARQVASVAAGLLFFAASAYAINLLALAAWPAYAAVYPERAFTTPMLLARLGVSTLALLGSGIVVAALARPKRLAVVIAAMVMLLLGGINHLTEPTWSHYPLWYHLVFIGSIAPCILIGGRLRRDAAD